MSVYWLAPCRSQFLGQLLLSPGGCREEFSCCVLVYFGRGSFFKCHMLAEGVTGASGTDVPRGKHLQEDGAIAIGRAPAHSSTCP